MTVYVTSAMW